MDSPDHPRPGATPRIATVALGVVIVVLLTGAMAAAATRAPLKARSTVHTATPSSVKEAPPPAGETPIVTVAPSVSVTTASPAPATTAPPVVAPTPPSTLDSPPRAAGYANLTDWLNAHMPVLQRVLVDLSSVRSATATYSMSAVIAACTTLSSDLDDLAAVGDAPDEILAGYNRQMVTYDRLAARACMAGDLVSAAHYTSQGSDASAAATARLNELIGRPA